MKRLALAAIRGYQRFLSPLKGFSCAFRVATGADSCSAYGYRVIGRFGLRRGLGLLDRRLALCGHVHRRMRPARAAVPHHPWRRRQQGFCDLPCDGPDCDLQGCHCDACDVCDICDCGSNVRDWWRRNRNGQMDGRSAQMDAAVVRVREQQARKRREGQQS
jgi:putative component of membrane protein insertase Oxa1/YidC/SpoIIIJ protein YidD